MDVVPWLWDVGVAFELTLRPTPSCFVLQLSGSSSPYFEGLSVSGFMVDRLEEREEDSGEADRGISDPTGLGKLEIALGGCRLRQGLDLGVTRVRLKTY